MDHFRTISDWHHFAILSLSDTENYRHDPSWIAARLGIGLPQAREALKRLERLGMLVASPDGKATRGSARYSTSDGIADLSLRQLHSQNLELARRSLENDPVDARDFTATTMAIDPERLPEARRMIRAMQDRVVAFLEGGARKEVHKICVQLIPLTRSETA